MRGKSESLEFIIMLSVYGMHCFFFFLPYNLRVVIYLKLNKSFDNLKLNTLESDNFGSNIQICKRVKMSLVVVSASAKVSAQHGSSVPLRSKLCKIEKMVRYQLHEHISLTLDHLDPLKSSG